MHNFPIIWDSSAFVLGITRCSEYIIIKRWTSYGAKISGEVYSIAKIFFNKYILIAIIYILHVIFVQVNSLQFADTS